MKTIPTLLTTTQAEFIEQMQLFQPHYARIQLDIGDGQLVPNTTTQISDIKSMLENNEVSLTSTFDFHLMVQDYAGALEEIRELQKIGMQVDTALINAGLKPQIDRLQTQYEFKLGLDVFPEVTIPQITTQYDLSQIETIQIMTVNPGFQGSPFLPEMLLKIKELRKQNYAGSIMIDGGVNGNTIPTISSKEHKPDYICIGSYLTKAGADLETRIEELKKLE
ncbi:MAG: hypothetical protein ACEQSA_00345 [Weeksellaceae bacterium]